MVMFAPWEGAAGAIEFPAHFHDGLGRGASVAGGLAETALLSSPAPLSQLP